MHNWHDMPHAERHRATQLLGWQIDAEYSRKLIRCGVVPPAELMTSALLLLADARLYDLQK